MRTLCAATCLCALLASLGCVTQQTYDQARSEADSLARSLAGEQADLQALEQELSTLQRATRATEAELGQLHAAMQRAMEEAALTRQRSDEKIAALQTQAAALVNQSRAMRRELAEAKQENVSLQASVAQYKSDLQEMRPSFSSGLAAPAALPRPEPSAAGSPSPTPTAAPSAPPVLTPTTPPTPPGQTTAAQTAADGDAGAKPITTRPTKPTQEADSSWTGLIKGWVSSIWDWIFG